MVQRSYWEKTSVRADVIWQPKNFKFNRYQIVFFYCRKIVQRCNTNSDASKSVDSSELTPHCSLRTSRYGILNYFNDLETCNLVKPTTKSACWQQLSIRGTTLRHSQFCIHFRLWKHVYCNSSIEMFHNKMTQQGKELGRNFVEIS